MAKRLRRDPRIEARWRETVRRQKLSGVGVREFCRENELTESAFYFWRHELQRRQVEGLSGAGSAKPEAQRQSNASVAEPPKPAAMEPREQVAAEPTFVPVRVRESDAASGRIEIALPSGVHLHIVPPVDQTGLADVLAALRLEEQAAARRAARSLGGQSRASEGLVC